MIEPPASWRWDGLKRVIAALSAPGSAPGQPARLVGGCVRDALLGVDAKDLDVATPLPPDEAMQCLRDAGIKVVPTGIAHGTVTAVIEGRPIEITTLRRDLATDGRHAEVAFIADWAADAERRDLTINALFADLDGTVHDLVGGLADLRAGRVRFVGDPTRRIHEDYLRIPRFFRFYARFARLPPDAETVAAMAQAMAGIDRLAGERVKAELFALLALDQPMAGVTLAATVGYWPRIWGAAGDLSALERLIGREAANALPGDPLRRLAALAGNAATAPLAERLRLSKAEAKRLLAIPPARAEIAEAKPNASQPLRRKFGATAARDAALIAAPEDRVADWLRVTEQEAPTMPLSAEDLLQQGMAPGPELGRRLSVVQAWWDAAEGAPDRAACLRKAMA
jgi:poly(A) polymerase